MARDSRPTKLAALNVTLMIFFSYFQIIFFVCWWIWKHKLKKTAETSDYSRRALSCYASVQCQVNGNCDKYIYIYREEVTEV
jgi:mannose/fructose/N-acetylgalactosamine-specific phosphotransferase system component IIC